MQIVVRPNSKKESVNLPGMVALGWEKMCNPSCLLVPLSRGEMSTT